MQCRQHVLECVRSCGLLGSLYIVRLTHLGRYLLLIDMHAGITFPYRGPTVHVADKLRLDGAAPTELQIVYDSTWSDGVEPSVWQAVMSLSAGGTPCRVVVLRRYGNDGAGGVAVGGGCVGFAAGVAFELEARARYVG